MSITVLPGAGQRAQDVTGEMADRIKALIYEYSGHTTLAAAVGVLTIVQYELMANTAP